MGREPRGKGTANGKALRKEKAGAFNEQQRSRCGWRGGSDMNSRRRGANHKGLIEHREGSGFYSKENGSCWSVLSRMSDLITSFKRVFWLSCSE